MVGLPRSGKSTWAKEQGYPVVSRDAIRLSLHGTPFLESAKDLVTFIEKHMVQSLFNSGHQVVIVDSCHVRNRDRIKWFTWAMRNGIQTYFKELKTPYNECIQRAIDTEQEYLVPVISRMNKNYEPLMDLKQYEWKESKVS